MKKVDIVRAWKDESYRQTLTQEELAQLPEHPSGLIELTNSDLAEVKGAYGGGGFFTLWGACAT